MNIDKTKKYYVSSGFAGNCLIFWKKGGHGYSCNLSEAEVFNGDDKSLISIVNEKERYGIKKYRTWDKEYIDKNVVVHVDSEMIDINNSI